MKLNAKVKATAKAIDRLLAKIDQKTEAYIKLHDKLESSSLSSLSLLDEIEEIDELISDAKGLDGYEALCIRAIVAHYRLERLDNTQQIIKMINGPFQEYDSSPFDLYHEFETD